MDVSPKNRALDQFAPDLPWTTFSANPGGIFCRSVPTVPRMIVDLVRGREFAAIMGKVTTIKYFFSSSQGRGSKHLFLPFMNLFDYSGEIQEIQEVFQFQTRPGGLML